MAERNTFGTSHLPWSLPGVRNIVYENCCPNAERVLNDHITLSINECWSSKEIDDVIKAFTEVERRYRR